MNRPSFALLCDGKANGNRTDRETRRDISVQNSLLQLCYLQLTNTVGFTPTKPYRGFEPLSLRHAVCSAEKFLDIAEKCATNRCNSALFIHKPDQRKSLAK